MSKYISASTIQKTYEVSTATLRRWDEEKKVEAVRGPRGKRLYNADQINQLLQKEEGQGRTKTRVCYAQVSSEHQLDDLERQIEDLRKACPGREILSDIGSGVNFKRRNFQRLLERAFEGTSNKLPLHIKTDCVESVMTLSNSCFPNSVLKSRSWFQLKAQRLKEIVAKSSRTTCYLLLPCLWQDIMDREQQKTKEGESAKEPLKKKIRMNARSKKEVPAGKTITIRLYPDKQQKEILMKWLGTTRWTYNKCLDAINKDKIGRSETTLRALWLNSKPLSEKSVHWVLETTYDVRNQAMNDLLKAFGSCLAKGEQFQTKHRTRKDKQQSIVIEPKHWGKKRIICLPNQNRSILPVTDQTRVC